MGGCRHLAFIDHLTEWSERAAARGDACPTGAAGATARLGCRQAELCQHRVWSPCRTARCASSWPGWRPDCQRRQGIVGRADGIPLYAVDGPDAGRGRSSYREDGVVSPGRRPLDSRGPGHALVPHRLATRCPRRGGSRPAPTRGHPRSELPGSGACGRLRGGRGRPRSAPAEAGPAGAADRPGRSPITERGQFVFVQSLIREVAYNTLSKKARKAGHLAAARYFESLGTDELSGALATHYLAAHVNSPDGAEARRCGSGAHRVARRGGARRRARIIRPGCDLLRPGPRHHHG